MKATQKQLNDAKELLKAIEFTHSYQITERIFGEALETLYEALQEVEIDNNETFKQEE